MIAFARIQEALLKRVWRFYWTADKAVHVPAAIQNIHRRAADYGIEYPEYVCRVQEPAFIEPRWGYVITQRGRLIESSLNPNYRHPKRPLRLGAPDPVTFRHAQSGKDNNILHFPEVILLRHFWEWNYYHFYFDVLGKISLFNDAGLDRKVPFVLGRYAMELPWVRQVLAMGALADRTWVIPDNQYVLADRIYYSCTQHNYKLRTDYLLNEMQTPLPSCSQNARLFLNRDKNSTRHIHNIDELLPVFAHFGFEVVTTEGLLVSEQIKLFNRARYLVAIHGAGVTNIIFRRAAPFSLLELHPLNYLSTDFKRICQEYGFAYDTIGGEPDPSLPREHTNFTISPEELRKKLEIMLAGNL